MQPLATVAHAGHQHPAPTPPAEGGGHSGHHGPNVFPGQPPAYVLPKPVGPGVTQPADIPDTAKGSPLPHWDGVLLGSALAQGKAGLAAHNLYVNGAFNYLDHKGSVEDALTAVKQLTAGPDRPAAVLWRDKFGIVHAQALLQYSGLQMGPKGSTPLQQEAPVAAHLGAGTLGVNLGHPEAIAIVDGDLVFGSSVGNVTPVPGNGGTGWSPGG